MKKEVIFLKPILIEIANRLLRQGGYVSYTDISTVFEEEYPDYIAEKEKGDLCKLTEKSYYNAIKHAIADIQELLNKKNKKLKYEGKGRNSRFAYPDSTRLEKELEEKGTKSKKQYLLRVLNFMIIEGKALDMVYNAGFQRLKELQFHPYRLKQYNNRWFVVGLSIEGTNVYEDSIYAIDRIIVINERPDIKYIRPKKDYAHFFDDIIGVTHVKNRTKVLIELVTLDKYTHYRILTKPFHSSQKEITPFMDDEGVGRISINVIPNLELITQLLSFGATIKVTSPPEIVEEMIKRVKEMARIYEL